VQAVEGVEKGEKNGDAERGRGNHEGDSQSLYAILSLTGNLFRIKVANLQDLGGEKKEGCQVRRTSGGGKRSRSTTPRETPHKYLKPKVLD